MDLLTFPGAAAVLTRHRAVLPQPDQLCGPFATHVALHALLPAPPSIADLAVSAGTLIWPSDVAEWRPPGAPSHPLGWGTLAHAATPELSGTDAVGVAAAIAARTGVEVIPVRGAGLELAPLQGLLALLLDGPELGVVANVRTGPMDPGADFDVGHFVVLWGCSADGSSVGVADTYAELGSPGLPPGCRVLSAQALLAGLSAPPGRGLLLLTAPAAAPGVRRLVAAVDATSELWST